jgi:MFS family permease
MNILNKNNLIWIYILSASIYGCQGLEGLVSLPLFAYFKETLHLDASSIMYLSLIVSICWGIKPLWGIFIDNYLTHKKWITLSLIGSTLICFFMGINNFLSLPLLIILMSAMSLTTAWRDISLDAVMCVQGKATDNCDRIQTIQWTALTIAGIFVALMGGYIADKFNYKIAYLCLIPVYLIIIGIVAKYKGSEIRETQLTQKPTLIQSILSYRELFTNKQFVLGALFLFVYNFSPGFGVPLQFIMKNSFHWSYSFMGIISAISSGFGIIGAIIYFKYCKQINIKKCLFYSVFFIGITNICYLYFTPVSAIIYSCIFSVLGMFVFLNLMAYMAKSTLPGKEAVSFALLCSVNNLSGMFSTLVGAWLFPLIGLKVIIILASLSAFLSLPILKRLEIK